MARQIQLRRGTTEQNENFKGAVGEVIYDTEKKHLRVHDGSTVGGTIIPNDDEVVHKTGNVTEYITGTKVFTTNAPVRKMSTEIDGTAHYNVGYIMQDKNGTDHGYLRTAYTENNNVSCGIQATRKIGTEQKYASIDVGIKEDGTFYAHAPIPDTSTTPDSNEIVTVGWVNSSNAEGSNIVHKTDDENIHGIKKFINGIRFDSSYEGEEIGSLYQQVLNGALYLGLSTTSTWTNNYINFLPNNKTFVHATTSVQLDGSSPALTYPSPESGSNSNEIATTAWVKSLLGNHYVIAFQKPTESNNYTWYRKYADGWVEQGGIDKFASTSNRTGTITLPITLTGNEYSIQMSAFGSGGQGCMKVTTQTATNFTYTLDSAHDNFRGTKLYWQVSGMAA